MRDSRGAVAITGLGHVGPLGAGWRQLAAGLTAGEPKLTTVDRTAGFHRGRGSLQAVATDREALAGLVSARAARRMSWLSRFGVAAARLALEDGGLASEGQVREEATGVGTAVITATTFGSPTVTEDLLRAIFEQGPEAASPFLFPESVANAPAAQIAIAFQAKGPNLTITQRSSGPLRAVARGVREIRAGRAERALVGVSDEIHPVQHAVLDSYRALARRDPQKARPFDLERDGFLLGEGATVLLLEPLAVARQRGAKVWAEVRGDGAAFDASATAYDWGQGGQALARGLRRSLHRAGIEPDAFDLVVSGANGSRRGDRLEAAVLHELWPGDEVPPVQVPKGVTGEYGGGFLAAAVLAAAGQGLGPAAGFTQVDPELSIVPRPPGPDFGPGARCCLVSNLAPGGAAAWLVLATAEQG